MASDQGSARSVTWRWTISPWRAKKRRWGVEILRRRRLKHSQIRVHLGRRRFTLMCISTIKREQA